MERHDLKHLESKIEELRVSLTNLADDKGFADLLTIIHKPGFTSVAEHLLLRGMVDSMIGQAKSLSGLRQALLAGANAVELNPQPLPP
jgi:hypothetical protein